jgi:hypothetical protein
LKYLYHLSCPRRGFRAKPEAERWLFRSRLAILASGSGPAGQKQNEQSDGGGGAPAIRPLNIAGHIASGQDAATLQDKDASTEKQKYCHEIQGHFHVLSPLFAE